MLRSIGKQSGESVESVWNEKANGVTDDESGESMEPREGVSLSAYGWQRGIGVVVSGVHRMNEVNARWPGLGWVTIFGRVCHLGM